MKETLEIPATEILPTPDRVLAQQGVPAWARKGPIMDVAARACDEATTLLSARAMLTAIDLDSFHAIYPGVGENAPLSPLTTIYPQANALALFAVTAGAAICDRITQLFTDHEYALGTALDAAASLAADGGAQWTQEHFAAGCLSAQGVLRYSPGYCGWHVSGQHDLFATLAPAEIGITLGESCIMNPIKSVSGVIISGPPQIHEFEPHFDFCDDCADYQCRRRIKQVRSQANQEA